MIIRPEQVADAPSVEAVVREAFGRREEAELVARLRVEARPQVSLVAVDGAEIVGHIFFSPVTLVGGGLPRLLMGLAPMAVVAARQRSGIGSRLVHDGLAACRRLGAGAVVVLGHREYYPRFGFVPAARFGLDSEYGAGDAFMAQELTPGALAGVRGRLRYLPAFSAV